MKLFLFSVCFFMSSLLMAGGFPWPNFEYDYARGYLMNVPYDEQDRPEYYIYHDGIFSKSKVGNGYEISDENLNALHSILVRGVDELMNGLSGCYIPRHGIIYYDKLGNPVASLTICFECERIVFWSSEPLKESHHHKVDIDKAEKQLLSMRKILVESNVPVFDQPDQYLLFIDTSEEYKNNGEMFFHLNESDTLFNEYFSKGTNWLWVHREHRNKFVETLEVMITAGGDEIAFNQFSDNKGTRFIYLEGSTHMTEATIISNLVTLPNGVKVGMSTDEVIATFPVYDGIAWPEMISQEFPKYTVEYHFKRQTLIRIEMRSN